MHNILVVDDEARIRRNLCEFLSLKGYGAVEASSGDEAVARYLRERPSSVLLDLNMPGMNGMETLRRLREIDPLIPVIVVTAQADIPSAVNAVRQGAYDFLAKPPDMEHLALTLARAVEKLTLERTVRDLDTSLTTALEATFGPSEAMKKLITQLRRVAGSELAVLIQGETGTGKTHLAGLLHSISGRAGRPFIKVSIGSLQDSVVESELFGHEKGAFTGADKGRKGYFEMAEGGTLFIDDLDNISPLVQGKLLSVVEDKQVFRVGSPVPVALNIRLIGATNADLLKCVTEKKFREDLFFRLSAVTLKIPPLRERKEDIDFFAKKFFLEACAELNNPSCVLSDGTLELLRGRSWPGNLRELKNAVTRIALFAGQEASSPEELEALISHDTDRHGSSLVPDPQVVTIKDAEKMAIRKALAAAKEQKLKAASLLQIDYKTLVRKMREYHI